MLFMALYHPNDINIDGFGKFIFINFPNISPFVCLQKKCPDSLKKWSGILDHRLPSAWLFFFFLTSCKKQDLTTHLLSLFVAINILVYP